MSLKLQILLSYCLIVLGQLHYSQTLAQCSIDNCSKTNNIQITNSNVTIITGSDQSYNKCGNDGYKTTENRKYGNHFPASSIKCFSYRIKAKNQTHIGLFSNSNGTIEIPWVEIVVGGLPNGIGNIFRKNGTDIGPTYNQQLNSLSAHEYRGFWVSWVGGNYRFGFKGQPPFMTWQDPNPFPIVSVGVDTCCGTKEEVVVEEPKCPGVNI